MAVSFAQGVQSTSASGAASSIVGPAVSSSAGNHIVAQVKWENNVDIAATPGSDPQGNTYVKGVERKRAVTLDPSGAIIYAENCAALSSQSTTVNFTGNAIWRVMIWDELDGVATSGSLNGTPQSAEGDSTSYSTPNYTTDGAGIIMGLISGFMNLGTESAGSGFTLRNNTPSDTFSIYRLSTSSETVTPAASSTAGNLWVMCAIAFDEAGGGGGATPKHRTPGAGWGGRVTSDS